MYCIVAIKNSFYKCKYCCYKCEIECRTKCPNLTKNCEFKRTNLKKLITELL